jgi:putative glycerol-1-phosphate prenyltransferase
VKVYQKLLDYKSRGEKGLFVLLDPDKMTTPVLAKQAYQAQEFGAKAILIGGSHLGLDNFESAIIETKKACSIPVVIFPGSANQISPKADAVLFLSLISGRNPQYLIGEQVISAPHLKRFGIEVISTGYMLVESGHTTAIEFISGTKPIPRDQIGIAVAHAIAGEMLGFKTIYLEAGSGADFPVPEEMISAIHKSISLPLIVGGGIKSPEVAKAKVSAGADFIVVGNALEGKPDDILLREMVTTIKI